MHSESYGMRPGPDAANAPRPQNEALSLAAGPGNLNVAQRAVARRATLQERDAKLSTAAIPVHDRLMNSRQIAITLNPDAPSTWLIAAIKKSNGMAAALGHEEPIFMGRYSTPAKVMAWLAAHPGFVSNKTRLRSRRVPPPKGGRAYKLDHSTLSALQQSLEVCDQLGLRITKPEILIAAVRACCAEAIRAREWHAPLFVRFRKPTSEEKMTYFREHGTWPRSWGCRPTDPTAGNINS